QSGYPDEAASGMTALTDDDRAKLLRWARQMLESAVRGQREIDIENSALTPSLCAPQGAFVTLKIAGNLRGCIGKMDFDRPVWRNVVEATVLSALEDPRF